LQEFERATVSYNAGLPDTAGRSGLTNEFLKVEHLVPMLSLENSYDEEIC
jgi:NAD-dependent DNA ligase